MNLPVSINESIREEVQGPILGIAIDRYETWLRNAKGANCSNDGFNLSFHCQVFDN